MKTGWKIAIYVLIALALITGGVLLGRALQEDTRTQEVAFSVIVRAPGSFELAMMPQNADGDPEIEVTKGNPAVFTIGVVANGGYDGKVYLEVVGFPEGSYTISPQTISPGETATLTIQTEQLTSNTNYGGTLIGSPA